MMLHPLPSPKIFSLTVSLVVSCWKPKTQPRVQDAAEPTVSMYGNWAFQPRDGTASSGNATISTSLLENLKSSSQYLFWAHFFPQRMTNSCWNQWKFVMSCERRINPWAKRGEVVVGLPWRGAADPGKKPDPADPDILWHQLINPKGNYFAPSHILTRQNHMLSRYFLYHMCCWRAEKCAWVLTWHTQEFLSSVSAEGQSKYRSRDRSFCQDCNGVSTLHVKQDLFHFLTTSCLKIQPRQQHPKAVPTAGKPRERVLLQSLMHWFLLDILPDQD